MNGYVQAPKSEFISNARPSLFAYPTPTKPPQKSPSPRLRQLCCRLPLRQRHVKGSRKRRRPRRLGRMETVSDLMSDFPGPLLYQISISNIKLGVDFYTPGVTLALAMTNEGLANSENEKSKHIRTPNDDITNCG